MCGASFAHVGIGFEGPDAGRGPEGDNGFDINIINSAVSASVSCIIILYIS